MAPDRGRDRSKDFKALASSGPQDFDPEVDEFPDGSSNSENSDDDATWQNGAREHYVDVGKSKIRRPKTAALGAQYRGSRISREAVADDEDADDPFGKGFDDEDSEAEAYVGFSNNAGAWSSGENEDKNTKAGSEADETSDTDISDDRAETARNLRAGGRASNDDRYEVLKSLANDQKDVASRLAQSVRADAEKGRAVKRQQKTFDSLLGTRIKLQKALIGANTVVGTPGNNLNLEQDEAKNAIERAEVAAFSLWSSLNDLREDLISARAGQKRKRNPSANRTATEDLWSQMREQEESTLPHRNAILQRWSVKTRSAAVQPQHGLLNKAERQTTIIDAIHEHVSNPDRLLKRAHTPRSCAPLQIANNVTEDDKIYDDADFYGILLKELLEQKSEDSATAANIDLNFNLHRETKTKKNVDTKASKGRKLRYTIHEKLQNFMAPEDRRRWGERQAEELFGSLFGQRLGLGEDGLSGGGDGDGDEDDMMEDAAADEKGGLMLFRG